jgi:hypothetical protein
LRLFAAVGELLPILEVSESSHLRRLAGVRQ